MDFSTALEELNTGKAVHRGMWSKSKFLFLHKGYYVLKKDLVAKNFPDQVLQHINNQETDYVEAEDCLMLYTDGKLLANYQPSPTDIFAIDWNVMELK